MPHGFETSPEIPIWTPIRTLPVFPRSRSATRTFEPFRPRSPHFTSFRAGQGYPFDNLQGIGHGRQRLGLRQPCFPRRSLGSDENRITASDGFRPRTSPASMRLLFVPGKVIPLSAWSKTRFRSATTPAHFVLKGALGIFVSADRCNRCRIQNRHRGSDENRRAVIEPARRRRRHPMPAFSPWR